MGSIEKKGLQQYLLQHQHQHQRLITKPSNAVNWEFLVIPSFLIPTGNYSGVLSAISDIVSRNSETSVKTSASRSRSGKLFGAVYLGPFGHFLHLLLDKIFKGKKDSKTVAKKFWPVLGLDKSPVCATPSPCRLPQLGRFWLGNFPKLTSNICGITKG
ncbi:unnamed protein product [Prunus armeniaca]|uniref:Uncharacterized protein n=1 Tax=Prunus armeniaca TaxID=36596 RepID=A0A6J5X2F1_PRUAR|nr:unnamed protein product [Prunus armeniaca]